MFDIGWSELLIFAVVALIFVGREELPVLMRTIGKYAGIIRRQADEFRRHFDAAVQEAELDNLEAELNSVGKDIDQSLDDASSTIDEGAKAANEFANADIDAETREDKELEKSRDENLSIEGGKVDT